MLCGMCVLLNQRWESRTHKVLFGEPKGTAQPWMPPSWFYIYWNTSFTFLLVQTLQFNSSILYILIDHKQCSPSIFEFNIFRDFNFKMTWVATVFIIIIWYISNWSIDTWNGKMYTHRPPMCTRKDNGQTHHAWLQWCLC